MNKFNSLFSNLFLSLIVFLCIFIALEICAQVYILKFATEVEYKKYASLKQILSRENKLKYSPHPYMRYTPTPNYEKGNNKHNSLGYRGDEIAIPKPEGQFRIVCLGGSTTYTNNIDDYKMSYPYLLEEQLNMNGFRNVKVINSGAGGFTTWESLLNFEFRVLDLEPDMIIIYHAVNDINARLVWPPEAYKGDNTGQYFTTTYITVPSIFEYSTLIRIIMIKLGISDSQGGIARWGKMVDESRNTSYMTRFRKQKIDNTYPQDTFKKISAEYMLKTNKPLYFKRNIRNMVTIAKANSIKTVIATFAYSPLFKDNPLASSEEYIFAFDEMNSVLRDIATDMDVHLFDFAKLFPNERRYYYDGLHVVEEGAQLKAVLFAKYLIENDLVPQK